MGNGWVKYFADGKKEFGYDQLVREKKASWSKGRLDNMTAVELHHNGTTIAIEGTGQFWQSDTLETSLFSLNTQFVKRTLSKKIHERDTGFTVNNGIVKFFALRTSEDNIFFTIEEDIGKTFVLEIECNHNNCVSWRIE